MTEFGFHCLVVPPLLLAIAVLSFYALTIF